eukprot:TRINITY_DN2059_c1_g2_i1.p1 TRINITY_DN2059_c1_g2~~TRINITY_DN2059_c1_g2_i1.p1  ORF type:complete len:773 (+),score=271.30 TRINITY_DN2059_c1_g2_i1:119-2437(+)
MTRHGLNKSMSQPAGLSLQTRDFSSPFPRRKAEEVITAKEADMAVAEAAAIAAEDEDLEDRWTLWFDKVLPQSAVNEALEGDEPDTKQLHNDGCIVELASFKRLIEFWEYWTSLRVEHLRVGCNVRVFKSGIKPVAVDPANVQGGKWVVRGVPQEKRSSLWGEMVTMIVSRKVDEYTGMAVHGGVFSTRDDGDSMQLWVGGESADAKIAETAARLGWIAFKDQSTLSPFTFVYQPHETQRRAVKQPPAPSEPAAMTPAASAANSSCATTPSSDGAPALNPSPLSPTEQNTVLIEDDDGTAAAPQPGWYLTPTNGPSHNPQLADYALPRAITLAKDRQTRAAQEHAELLQSQQEEQARQQDDAALFGGAAEEDEEACDPADGVDMTPELRALQDRAKEIRSLKKKIRYINFFLQRQVKGRDLTTAERQKIASLPTFQQELATLQAQQQLETDVQKRLHGDVALEFLNAQQQPMKFTSEEERRYKTIRSLRKKVRFITHHVTRKKEGWALSHAEAQKVASLPSLEAELRRLEEEEERWVTHQKAMGNPDPRGTGKKKNAVPQRADETSQDAVNVNMNVNATALLPHGVPQQFLPQQPAQQYHHNQIGHPQPAPPLQQPQQLHGYAGYAQQPQAIPVQQANSYYKFTAPQGVPAQLPLAVSPMQTQFVKSPNYVTPQMCAFPSGYTPVQVPQACVPMPQPVSTPPVHEYQAGIESPISPASPASNGYYNTPYSPGGGPPPLDSPLISPPLSPLAASAAPASVHYSRSPTHMVGVQ